jgi:hypothetical protein
MLTTQWVEYIPGQKTRRAKKAPRNKKGSAKKIEWIEPFEFNRNEGSKLLHSVSQSGLISPKSSLASVAEPAPSPLNLETGSISQYSAKMDHFCQRVSQDYSTISQDYSTIYYSPSYASYPAVPTHGAGSGYLTTDFAVGAGLHDVNASSINDYHSETDLRNSSLFNPNFQHSTNMPTSNYRHPSLPSPSSHYSSSQCYSDDSTSSSPFTPRSSALHESGFQFHPLSPSAPIHNISPFASQPLLRPHQLQSRPLPLPQPQPQPRHHFQPCSIKPLNPVPSSAGQPALPSSRGSTIIRRLSSIRHIRGTSLEEETVWLSNQRTGALVFVNASAADQSVSMRTQRK